VTACGVVSARREDCVKRMEKKKVTKTVYVESSISQTYYAKLEITKEINPKDYGVDSFDELEEEDYEDDFTDEAEKIVKKNLEEGKTDEYEKEVNEDINIDDSYFYE